MGDELAVSLLDTYRHAPTLEEAEQALKALEPYAYDDAPPIGDLYDELAEIAAKNEAFGLAVRAQRRAIELGCEMPTLGREMLGWYLMKDGRRTAGEAEFDALRRDVGHDPEVLITLGHARADAGDERAGLAAYDEALAAAKEVGDAWTLDRARAERRFSREELGLLEDEDDRLAPRPLDEPTRRDDVSSAVSWFPVPNTGPRSTSGRSSRRISLTPIGTVAASSNTCASWPRRRDSSRRSLP